MCEIMWGQEGAVREMVFFGFVYTVIIGIVWAGWKKYPQHELVQKSRKMLIWSPILRCLIMTWFGTALWTLTYFHGS